MLGTFAPRREPYVETLEEETTPFGVLARGIYSAKLKCPYADTFWRTIQEDFKWSVVWPGNIQSFLDLALAGHPFNSLKKMLWESLVKAFSWNIWLERNHRTLKDKCTSVDKFIDSTLYLALFWIRLLKPFRGRLPPSFILGFKITPRLPAGFIFNVHSNEHFK